MSKRMKSMIPALFLALFLMGSAFAQVQDTRPDVLPQENDMYRQNAERWTQTLNNRLTLTDDQQTRINSILIDYQTRRGQLGTQGDATTLQNDVNRQIEGVLDDNQRTNWDAYSTTWWTDINRSGTGFDQRNRMDQDIDTDDNQDMNNDTDTDRNIDDTDTGDDDEL